MTEPQTAPTTTMQELARRWVHEHDEDAFTEYCRREAARLDAEETMTEPSTAPTVFVPDMDAVDDATRHATNRFDIVCKAYVELERQMTEAGYVVVRREIIQEAWNHCEDAYLCDGLAAALGREPMTGLDKLPPQIAEAGYVVVREDSVLRERAERLRLILAQMPIDREESGLQPGDLADDLTPLTE